MTYAIEVKSDEQPEYIIVDGEKVVHRMGDNPFLTITKANHHGFTMHPGRVFFEPKLDDGTTPQERIAILQSLIQKGATTVVIACHLNGSQVLKKLAKARHIMINSPIDFVIGITVNIHELTPKLMIELSKRKLPFIRFSFDDWDEVFSKTWEWIRDANLGHRALFIPHWQGENIKPRDLKRRYAEWNDFAKLLNIPTTSPLSSEQPLTLGQLKSLGIYPVKGQLLPGSDCDYALYPSLLDGQGSNRYDEHKPSIVVIRGKIQLAGQELYRPGYGREIKIHMSGRFTDYWECMSNNG